MDGFIDPALVQNGALHNAYDAGTQNGAEFDPQVKHEDNDVKEEDDEVKADDEEMQDLFGDDDADEKQEDSAQDEEEEPAVEPSRDGSEALSSAELQHRRNLEYEEDDGQEEAVVELKHAVLSIPNIPTPRSSDENTWIFRLPNFVKLDPKPFSTDTYVGPDQLDEAPQGANAREKSMSIKLEVENTLRWKWKKDEFGEDKRVSNSRIIRWSDGSLSLLLGKELFDVNQNYENPASTLRQGSSATQQSQSQAAPSTQAPTNTAKGAGLTYIVAQHKRPGILQAEAPVTGYMSLRPTGMQSETHRLLARAVGQKHSKVARLRMAPDPTVDPEREKAELMKQAARKPRARRADDLGGGGAGGKKKRASYGRRRESVWSDEEPEPGAFADSDDEDDGLGGDGERRRTRSGGSESKRGTGEYQTDDFLVSDDSEGEGGEDESESEVRRKRKGKRKHRSSEDTHDALDEMDAKIERQEHESRRKKREVESAQSPAGDADVAMGEKSEDADGDVDMDVESEDEEDFDISRAGTSGGRRKRAIAVDDEEDE
ncbi:hypothetical protein SCHPADRAFT_843477 [Schizopora paradoxa]|uniref:Leo1-domain-containing protein n=1 Tax=Schizopora paradoxa TaxID=27342 RepID=A0A0H2SQC2_9AGAM|nr:hypothetical protein SCHPADRAFT_843477 [Schizopora paradoxa]